MIAMTNSLSHIFHCQKTQNDTTHALHVIHPSELDRANDSLIDDIPTFGGKSELYFDWILKLENIAVVSKCNPNELA